MTLTVAHGQTQAPKKSAKQRIVRIAIIKDIANVEVSVRGPYEICDPKRSICHQSSRVLNKVKVVPTAQGIKIGEKEYAQAQLRIKADKDITITTPQKEKRYRGTIDFVKNQGGRLSVINRVELEDYVRGILYHEVSHRWTMESLKVQAVAARTYAVYQMQNNKRQPYDVTSDIYSQVYGGRSAERYRTNLAVRRTLGEVMVYNNKILPAYYHAACAGHTEDVSELWKQDLAPLKGVKCDFCRNSPHKFWKRNFRSKDVQEKLNKHGFNIGLIEDISVAERNRSGRIKNLLLTDRDGKTVTVPGKDFRTIIGPNILKSNNYEIVMRGYFFDILGKGWGHGVGMCQWGVQGMAIRQYPYNEILKFYYPGIAIVDVNDSAYAL